MEGCNLSMSNLLLKLNFPGYDMIDVDMNHNIKIGCLKWMAATRVLYHTEILNQSKVL